jgi:integrase
MKIKQSGSVFDNHGLWYYSVKLPGEKRRRQVPLKAPNSNHTLKTDRPRKMAEEAAARYWEKHTRQAARKEPRGATVAELVAAWDAHCLEYYRGPDGKPTSTALSARIDVRLFRDLYGNAALAELTHADMLQLRDAYVRSGISRTSVNKRLWRVKAMLAWALDEALITASVKAELTQVKAVKRGRTSAPERAPIRPVDDDTIEATLAKMMPNTADMVRVHRLTGMRPCEVCALRWSLIDRTQTPWVYRVPPEANKNEWRGELGMPRVVCIGPKARAILSRHLGGGDYPFSPQQAMAEHLERRHAERVTPFYKSRKTAPHVPRKLGAMWSSGAYGKTIAAACKRAQIEPWGANRLRHTFGTAVRRQFGLDAAKAVLGHTDGGRVTNLYTFDAVEEEAIRRAAPAVEALG